MTAEGADAVPGQERVGRNSSDLSDVIACAGDDHDLSDRRSNHRHPQFRRTPLDRRLLVTGLSVIATEIGRPAFAQAASPPQLLLAQFAATLTAHDIDAFAALFADDYVNHQTSAAAPPPPAGTTPKQNTVGFFRARLTGLPDLKVSIEASVVSADSCAASYVYEGTHNGTYFGVAPTGRKLRFTSCDIFTVRGGKLFEHWGMGDAAGVLAQLKA